MTKTIQQAFAEGNDELPVIASVMTPYQLLFLEQIWTHLPTRPMLLIDGRPANHRAARPPRLQGLTQYLELDLTGQVNSQEQARLVRQAMAEAERFAGGMPVLFACASYQAPVNNAIYTRHRQDRSWHFLLFEEGLSTYLALSPTIRERLRNVAREAVSRLRRFPRRTLFGGHPQGLDLPELRAIIVVDGQTPPGRSAQRLVALPSGGGTELTFNPDNVLFAGQPFVSAYGFDPELIRACAAEIFADLKNRGFKKIAFKAHHFQSAEDAQIYLDEGFELYESPLPLEEMIAQSEFRTIASVNTTALLTARSLYGEAVQSIAYSPADLGPHYERRDMNEVIEVFRRGGVEIVHLISIEKSGTGFAS